MDGRNAVERRKDRLCGNVGSGDGGIEATMSEAEKNGTVRVQLRRPSCDLAGDAAGYALHRFRKIL
jgi:hypothetical protein